MFVQDRGRKLATLAVTCIGLFMVLLDMTIVNVALPTIQSDLKTSLADLQWVVDAYTLPFAALLLTAGTLGDRYGRKRMFLVGLVVFTLGSALCGFAPSLQWLIAGRILQGAGGAALSPGSLSLLAAAFPDNRERTQAIGIWAGISGLALAAGPLAGGLLIQISSWPAIFFVNLPIGVLAFIFGWRILAESRNPEARRLDLPGQVLVIGGLAALTYALIEGEAKGWTSPLILSLFIGAGVFLLAFLAVEARAREPLLPLQLFKSVTFSAANAAAVLLGFALLGTAFFISQYFQSVQGASALGSGLRTLHALEILRDEEGGAQQGKAQQHRCRVGRREGDAFEKLQGQQRLARARLNRQEGEQEHARANEERENQRRGPAFGFAFDQRVGQRRQPANHQHLPRQIKASGLGIARLRQDAPAKDEGQHADGQIDKEDGRPA